MKARELRELDAAELEARIGELRASYFDLKIKRATGQTEDVARMRGTRRDLARALTVQAEKRRAG